MFLSTRSSLRNKCLCQTSYSMMSPSNPSSTVCVTRGTIWNRVSASLTKITRKTICITLSGKLASLLPSKPPDSLRQLSLSQRVVLANWPFASNQLVQLWVLRNPLSRSRPWLHSVPKRTAQRLRTSMTAWSKKNSLPSRPTGSLAASHSRRTTRTPSGLNSPVLQTNCSEGTRWKPLNSHQ